MTDSDRKLIAGALVAVALGLVLVLFITWLLYFGNARRITVLETTQITTSDTQNEPASGCEKQ